MNRQQVIQRALALLLAALLGMCAGMLLPRQAEEAARPAPDGAAAVYASWLTEEDRLLLAQGPQATPTPAPEPQENLFAVSAPPATPAADARATPAQTAAQAPEQASEQTPAPPGQAGFAIKVLGVETEKPRKRVLIYHTHTYEAYEQTDGGAYVETEKWRTADSGHNVVRVGEELAALLRGLGIEVVHDVTAFEPPELSSAYTRSLEMLKRRISAGEQYDFYIDLHRDAYVESQAGSNTVNVGGAEVAKLMLLIGKGEGQTSQGFDQKPDWQANLRIAQEITEHLNAQADGLCRNVRLKSGRFNQHVAVGCMLVEAGNNKNTLEEVLAAMPYLADAVSQALEPS